MSAPAPARFVFARRPTLEVSVGALGIGAHNPLRVQSMTTTDTRDVRATVAQIARLAEAGCELVRVTAPGLYEARALGEIRAALDARGLRVPLCADIHFTPNAALEAAKHVEKVRINPGNYADSKKFLVREYSDAEYRAELERVAARVRPLVRRCRELGRALRIGANHGSLSDRILNRFGDTPLGMVESALEFLDVCEDENFRDVIFSMKSSNPRVAIHAYRLLAARLAERAPGAPSYPFHLGVTEAGDGEDARIKSAIGIGALLEDGIGDTLRVSLTEDPVREVPVARALAERYDRRAAAPPLEFTGASPSKSARAGAPAKARANTQAARESATTEIRATAQETRADAAAKARANTQSARESATTEMRGMAQSAQAGTPAKARANTQSARESATTGMRAMAQSAQVGTTAKARANTQAARVASPSLAPRVASVDDRFSRARRKTRAWGTLGAGQPVRVEALLGPVPADAAGAVREIARELEALGELVCEGLMVEVRAAAEVQRLADFARALAALPDAPPLAAFSTAELAPACAPHVARVAFEITGAAPAPHTFDTPAEWVLGADARAFARALEHGAPALASTCALLATPAFHQARAPRTPASGEAAALYEARESQAPSAPQTSAPYETCAPVEAPASGAALALHETREPLATLAPHEATLPPTHAVRRLVALLRAQGHAETPIALRHINQVPLVQKRTPPAPAKPGAARDARSPLPEARRRTAPTPAPEFTHSDAALLRAATDIGAALCDGLGDLVSLGGMGSFARDVRLAYRILQGARLRSSWTEFISCPSCGRTLFDLEETTARVKAATAHLAGLKIAVMGCIVNGPGEMADADFGYVGSGVGRVDLYAGRERVLRNVDAESAPARLVDLIRSHGRWVDPPGVRAHQKR